MTNKEEILIRAVGSILKEDIAVNFFTAEDVLAVSEINLEEVEELKQKSDKQTKEAINEFVKNKLYFN